MPTPADRLVTLPSGEPVRLRAMVPDDAARFGAFLLGLSPEIRSYWRPHPFDQGTADAVCAAIDPSDVLPLIATVEVDGEERITGYCPLKLGVREADATRYASLGVALDPATDAAVAPCVADAYLERGLGSVLLAHALEIVRSHGRTRVVLWGGVQARNARAIRFYERWGFRKVGEFLTDQNNYAMILVLPPVSPSG